MKKLLDLFLTFLKIGAFTFGGGYAMIALMQKDVVEKKKWLTDEEMVDLVAIAETTPGVIALNTATFVGAKIGGFCGAMLASIAVLLPSMIIITLIGKVIYQFGNNQYVRWAFWGIRSAVVALILSAVLKLGAKAPRDPVSIGIMIFALVMATLASFDVIKIGVEVIIIIVALFGIIRGYINRKRTNNLK